MGGGGAQAKIFGNIVIIIIQHKMKGMMRLVQSFSGKKLGVAETVKVVQDKIMNITQVVLICRSRMMSRNSEL